MITRDFQILIQKLVLIADSDRYLCLTRELYICYEHAKRVYVYRLWGSLYHTINLSIIMKTILEGTFPHCPSNATVSLKSLLCLKEKWQMAVVLYFPLVFLFFFKCSQSWQQKQAKYNLDAWATALIVIRRILSFQWEHFPTIVRRGRTARNRRDTWSRTLWTWTTHEYLKIVMMSAVAKDGRMSSGSHMTGCFSHTTSFNVCV